MVATTQIQIHKSNLYKTAIWHIFLLLGVADSRFFTKVTIYPDLNNKAVKTNVTIPAWLKELAEEKGVNFSQLLQTSLREYLNV